MAKINTLLDRYFDADGPLHAEIRQSLRIVTEGSDTGDLVGGRALIEANDSGGTLIYRGLVVDPQAEENNSSIWLTLGRKQRFTTNLRMGDDEIISHSLVIGEGEAENAGTVIQPLWQWFSDSPEEASQVDAIVPVPGSSDIIALIATDKGQGKDEDDNKQRNIHQWRFSGDGSIKTRRKMDELPYRETRKERSPRQDVGNSGIGADGFFFEAQHLNVAGRTPVYKCDFNGKKLWSVDWESSSFIHIHRTLPLSDGGCIVLGEHASDAAVIRISGDVSIVWSKRYEREQRQILFQGIVDESAGRMAVSGVTGEFNKFGVGEMRVWLAEIDLALGELLTETSFPGRTAAITKLGSDWVVAYDRNTMGIKADLAITRLSSDFKDQWTTAIDDVFLMSSDDRLMLTKDQRIIYVTEGAGRLRLIELLDVTGNVLQTSFTTSFRPYSCRQFELAGDQLIVGLDDFVDGTWVAGLAVFPLHGILNP